MLGEAHYFDETVNGDKIKKLLDNIESSGSRFVLAARVVGWRRLLMCGTGANTAADACRARSR